MSSRTQQLAARRAQLIARSQQLRAQVADHGEAIVGRLGALDRGLAMARAATRRPVLVTAAGILLLFLRPARALKWAARGAVFASLLGRALDFFEFAQRPGGQDGS